MSNTPAPKKSSGGLGRGLGALIPQKPIAAVMPAAMQAERAETAAPAEPTGAPLMVSVADIIPNPEQPRAVFKQDELEDLMNSIREHGILQPLTVTRRAEGGYELIAGERRFRASKMLGLEKVPVTVRDGDHDMNKKLVLALIENIQREDLNAIEEARGYQRLMEEFGLTQEEVSQRVGKARSTVANTVRLLTLPSVIRDAIAVGQITAGTARTILSLPTENEQLEYFQKVITAGMTTRDAEAGVRRAKGIEPRKDPVIEGAEEQLRNALGTRVEIKKRAGQGSITLSFYSDEEYSELLRRLSR